MYTVSCIYKYFCTKTTAQRIQSGFSMERTEETVKILTALLVRTTRIVLDEIRKLFIIGYIYWINVVRVHVVRVHGTFTTFVAY